MHVRQAGCLRSRAALLKEDLRQQLARTTFGSDSQRRASAALLKEDLRQQLAGRASAALLKEDLRQQLAGRASAATRKDDLRQRQPGAQASSLLKVAVLIERQRPSFLENFESALVSLVMLPRQLSHRRQ
jgi:hypothetical protein